MFDAFMQIVDMDIWLLGDILKHEEYKYLMQAGSKKNF